MPKDAAIPQFGTTRPSVSAVEAERAAARFGSIHERWSRLRSTGTGAARISGASGVSISPIVGIANGDTAVPLPIRSRATASVAAAAAESVGVAPGPPSAASSADTDELVALGALKPNGHWRWGLCGVLAVVVSIIYFAAGPEPGDERPSAGSTVRPAATRAETLRPAPTSPLEPVVEASGGVDSRARAPAAAPLPTPAPRQNAAPGVEALREATPSTPHQVRGPSMTKDPQPTKLHSARQKPPPKEGRDGIIGRAPF
jgi:hypothetical protein